MTNFKIFWLFIITTITSEVMAANKDLWGYSIDITIQQPQSPIIFRGTLIGDKDNQRRFTAFRTYPLSASDTTNLIFAIDIYFHNNIAHYTTKSINNKTSRTISTSTPPPLPEKTGSNNLHVGLTHALYYWTPNLRQTKNAHPHSMKHFFLKSEKENKTKTVEHNIRNLDSVCTMADILESLDSYRAYTKTKGVNSKWSYKMFQKHTGKILAEITASPLYLPDEIYESNIQQVNTPPYCPNAEEYIDYWKTAKSYLSKYNTNHTSLNNSNLIETIEVLIKSVAKPSLKIAYRQLQIQIASSLKHSTLKQLIPQFTELLIDSPKCITDRIKTYAITVKKLDHSLTLHPDDKKQLHNIYENQFEKLINSSSFSNQYLTHDILFDLNKMKLYWMRNKMIKQLKESGCITDVFIQNALPLLEAQRLASLVKSSDPNRATKTMISFMDSIKSPLKSGDLTLAHLNDILTNAYSSTMTKNNSKTYMQTHIANICNNLKTATLHDTFSIKSNLFQESLNNLCKSYPYEASGNNSRVIAALILLSFYDTSNTEDHITLQKQLNQLHDFFIQEFEPIRDTLVSANNSTMYDLSQLVYTSNQKLAKYIKNPFMPMFVIGRVKTSH